MNLSCSNVPGVGPARSTVVAMAISERRLIGRKGINGNNASSTTVMLAKKRLLDIP